MTSNRRPTDEAAQAAKVLRKRLRGLEPRVAIVLGSGLGGIVEAIERRVTVPYRALPGFPRVGVSGHAGAAVAGMLVGMPVICLSGRVHAYEGLPPESFRVPVRALRNLGVEILVLTNAAGSLRRSMGPGRLMLIADHINFLAMNPLWGKNDDAYGPRFPDMRDAYDPALRKLLRRAAKRARLALEEGVYLAYPGPSFETAAEIRAFRRLGADAVGMSTVPETIVARHCGLRVAALSVIVNLAEGLAPTAPSHQETLAVASKAAADLRGLLAEFLKALP